MASGIGDLVATLGMNNRPFIAKVNQSQGVLRRFSVGVTRTMGRIKGAFAGLATMTGAAGLLTGVGLLYGAKKAVDAATIQEQAEKKLAAVVKATGGAAGLSARQMAMYAADLQKVTNYGDEATISAMGILATFREIKGDQFKQATALAQDMSSVLDTDLKSSVVMIGKALNDPTKGLTAMGRAGIQFTEAQQKQIKALHKSGDMLSAQKIILKELEQQFGGTARAMADPLKQASNAWGDLLETLGNAIKPVFLELAVVFTKGIAFIQQYGDQIKATFAVAIEWGKIYYDLMSGVFRTIYGVVVDVFGKAQKFVSDVFEALGINSSGWFGTVIKNLDTMLGSWEGMRSGIVMIWTQTMLALQSAWELTQSWIETKLIEFKSAFVDTWYALGEEGVRSLMPTFTRFFQWLEKKRIESEGRKWTMSEGELAKIAMEDQKIVLGELGQQRVKAQKEAASQIEMLQKQHADRMAAIGQKSLDATAEWEKGLGTRPTLSGRLAGAWNSSLAKAQALDAASKAGGGALAGAASMAEKKEGTKALQRGSAEAWKKIVQATYGGSKKDKTAEENKKANQETARAVKTWTRFAIGGAESSVDLEAWGA